MQTVLPTKKEEEIVLPKSEFLRLKRQAEAYQTLAANVFDWSLNDSVDSVVNDFRNTDLYSEGFLNDLEDGLTKSSYRK